MKRTLAPLAIILLFILTSCGANSEDERVPFSSYLEHRSFSQREDKKYKKVIFAVLTNENFDETIEAFQDSLDDSWITKNGVEIPVDYFNGSKRYYREDSDNEISISHMNRERPIGENKYIITIIYGPRIEQQP